MASLTRASVLRQAGRASLLRPSALAAAAFGATAATASCAAAPGSSSSDAVSVDVPVVAPPSSQAKPAAATEQPAGGGGGMFDAVFAPFNAAYDTVYEYAIAPYAEPSRDKLLPDHDPRSKGREKPTLVVSLDGTLLESQWTRQFGWRYAKRPGVDEFLTALAPLYEIVLWTDALSSAEPVIDKLDARRLIRHRLYRDATTYTGGLHRKDLAALNRDISNVVIIDCDANCFSLQPGNGIAVKPYRAEEDPKKEDGQLKRLIPFLAFFAIGKKVNSVGPMAEELAALNTPSTLADNGEAFERATQERFKDLRAKGLMPVQKGGRILPGPNQRNPQGGGGGGSETIWSRMGIAGRR